MMNDWIQGLSDAMGANLWLAPFLAILAGVLTSFLPCALSSLPLVIGYVGGVGGHHPKRAFRLSLTFAIGMAVTLMALGTAAALLGRLMQGAGKWWYLVLGVLMVLMALQTFEIYNFIPSSFALGKSTKKGYIGAFVAGILGGLFSSPCATPMLVVLLAFVAKEGNLLFGMFLLLLYALGHSVLVLVAGTGVSLVQKITQNKKYGKYATAVRIAMGVAILAIAFYMFYIGL